ncbi:hypothetical protein D9613_012480 [Agrocybe pediades]|uniref:Uncharacterized protein n=1 Tax=Agrocybe pediades TaxID=84607 RepID=A0A8H4QS48_9AGAR|nr:hypothetical protein D9613_012480 [Agrocybe pediades]
MASSKTIIVGSMAALYALTTITVAINWHFTNQRFCTDGGSRDQIFLGPVTSSWMYVFASIVGGGATFIIADGVLVSGLFGVFYIYDSGTGSNYAVRCGDVSTHVANHFAAVHYQLVCSSWKYVVLVICSDVVSSLVYNEPQVFHVREFLTLVSVTTILDGAMYVSVAATSLAATYIICGQVYTHTKPGSRSRRRYRNVIDALIQSSALYSSVIVIEAVLYIVEGLPSSLKPTTPQNMNPIFVLGFFSDAVVLVTGIAPTLMVARLVLSSYNEDAEVSSISFPKYLITHPTTHSKGHLTKGQQP